MMTSEEELERAAEHLVISIMKYKVDGSLRMWNFDKIEVLSKVKQLQQDIINEELNNHE
jgi:hypothetical protein